MTQEDKELLLKDLCARLPHGVICKDTNINVTGTLSQIGLHYDMCVLDKDNGDSESCYLLNCKPYLFPLSSMTEEQKNDLTKNLHSNVFVKDEISFWCLFTANMMGEWQKVFEWCVKNHFDICGLIPMGSAIDATGLNIY